MNRFCNMPLPQLQQEISHLRTLPPSQNLISALIAYCWHLPDTDSALLDHITEAQILSEQLNYPLGTAYCNLLNIQFHIATLDSDSVRALFYTTMMNTAFEDPVFRGFYLVVEAGFHNIQMNVGLALVNLLEAIYLLEREKNNLGLLGAYDMLGWCYGILKDLESELAYRKLAYYMATQLENDVIILVIVNNCVGALAEFEKIEEAGPYLDQFEEILQRFMGTDTGAMAQIMKVRLLAFRASLFIHQNRLQEAQQYLGDAWAVELHPPVPSSITMLRYKVECDLAARQGNYKKAIDDALIGLAAAEQSESYYFQKAFMQKLVELYRYQRDFEHALYYSERIGTLKIAMISRTEINRIETIQQVRAYHHLTEASRQLHMGTIALQDLAQKLEIQNLRSLESPSY
jgi:hypothetical protein